MLSEFFSCLECPTGFPALPGSRPGPGLFLASRFPARSRPFSPQNREGAGREMIFELQGSYWYQKKRNEVFYRSIAIFFQFSNSQKTYDLRKLKISMKKTIFFTTSKEPNSHSFWATGLILVSKEAEFCAVQGYKVFFFIFRILKKNYAFWNFSFLDIF